jgi:hypothetical protein
MLSVHAFGLALTVGVLLAIGLRLLGFYATIPLTSLGGLLGLAWVGIVLNTITGVSIFMTRASQYISDVPFIVKMVFVVLGSISLAVMQRVLSRDAPGWQAAGHVPALGRRVALSSMLFWTAAVVTGRLIAYL